MAGWCIFNIAHMRWSIFIANHIFLFPFLFFFFHFSRRKFYIFHLYLFSRTISFITDVYQLADNSHAKNPETKKGHVGVGVWGGGRGVEITAYTRTQPLTSQTQVPWYNHSVTQQNLPTTTTKYYLVGGSTAPSQPHSKGRCGQRSAPGAADTGAEWSPWSPQALTAWPAPRPRPPHHWRCASCWGTAARWPRGCGRACPPVTGPVCGWSQRWHQSSRASQWGCSPLTLHCTTNHHHHHNDHQKYGVLVRLQSPDTAIIINKPTSSSSSSSKVWHGSQVVVS